MLFNNMLPESMNMIEQKKNCQSKFHPWIEPKKSQSEEKRNIFFFHSRKKFMSFEASFESLKRNISSISF